MVKATTSAATTAAAATRNKTSAQTCRLVGAANTTLFASLSSTSQGKQHKELHSDCCWRGKGFLAFAALGNL